MQQRPKINRRPRGAAAGILAGLALIATAHAAGYALKEQSTIGQGASFAGVTARADDPSMLFFNPASMASLPGYQISVNSSLIAPNTTLTRGTATRSSILGGGPIVGAVGENAAASAYVPAAYASLQLSPDWHAGLSVTSPFGLATKYDQGSLARYYALTTSLRTINIAPAVAWQVLPDLALGAAVLIEYADSHSSNAVDFGGAGAASGLAGLGFAPGSADGIASFHGTDTAVGWQIGASYEPISGTRIGVDYRSAIIHKLTGEVSFQGVPQLLAPAFSGGSAISKLPEPAIVAAGVAQTMGQWTLLADVTWTQWSTFRNLLVTYPNGQSLTVENWRDTWSVAFGADYRLSDTVTLRTGTAFDQTPTRDATRTPRIVDGNRYWLSVGATWKPLQHLALSAAYSHIFVDSAQVALTDAGPGTPNFLRGNLDASFHDSIDIGALQATLTF